MSRRGELITNDHVVKDCAKLTLIIDTQKIDEVQIKGRDKNSDLALLKANFQPSKIAYFRAKGSVRSGNDIIALGFPLHGLLGSQLKVSTGIVSATVGLLDDISQLQISAPIQPGNSGWPLLDEYGNVAGVVVAKLRALAVAKATGDIPQNVNFAVKD
ncbi:serine protease [Rhodospirillales bacterium]|nr:serine protease [Rhodospirillales bacterium]